MTRESSSAVCAVCAPLRSARSFQSALRFAPMQVHRFLACLLLLSILSSAAVGDDPISAEQVEFFEQRIRPVLVEHCYECHNSAGTAEAGLALDHRAGLEQGGESGKLLASDRASSLLLRVIRHEMDGQEMPEGGPKLASEVIRDFERWVELGMPDPRDAPPTRDELEKVTSWEAIREKRKQWWSFQPIIATSPPEANELEWNSNPIDRFVLASLEEAGLEHADAAEPEVVIRRLYYSLIGLPPPVDRIEEFVADNSEDAYLALVDELLQSKHFGERWARHWMDWIRYAESHGSEGDPAIVGAEHYRDYLIRALNADVAYDQLLREHLAGDLLAEPRRNSELGLNESLIGTAHWRMVFHGFAPTDVLDEKVRFTDDAINVVSKAFMGLTVSCARCHNHKFDAISQADYYALFGILASTRPGRAVIETTERQNAHRRELQSLKDGIRSTIVDEWSVGGKGIVGGDRVEQLVEALLGKGGRGELPDVATFTAQLRERYLSFKDAQHAFDSQEKLFDWNFANSAHAESWFRFGNGLDESPSKAGAFVISTAGETAIASIFPAGIYSNLVSDKHAGRLESEDMELKGDSKVWLQIAGGGNAMSRYVVQDYPRSGTVFPVTELKNPADADWHWRSYDMSYWSGDLAHIELTTAKDAPLLVKGPQRSWFGARRAVVTRSDASAPPTTDASFLRPVVAGMNGSSSGKSPGSWEEFIVHFNECLSDAIQAWASETASDEQALLLDFCLKHDILPNRLESLPNTRKLVEDYRALERAVLAGTRIPTLQESQIVGQPLYERGDHKQPRAAVPRRFLEVFGANEYPSKASGRRELAEDLLQKDNPFTSRVIVNRLWHHLFGQGIVATPDNIGRLGAEPTHPELLDYLATEFQSTDQWSIKSMLRRIVTSRTWRQASVRNEEALVRDPQNRLLSHYSVGRLEAEEIRDAMLAVSGELDATQFGPAVGGDSRRRSVYAKVIRNRLDPFLTAFNAPVPFSAVGKRDITNVPAQSLMLINGARVRELAEAFADRAQQAVTANPVADDPARSSWMWQKAFGRTPAARETDAMLLFLGQTEAAYREVRQQADVLKKEIGEWNLQMDGLLASVETRLQAEQNEGEAREQGNEPAPHPILSWDFETQLDSIADGPLELIGSARTENGELVLDGRGFARSRPLSQPLAAKTLEAVVRLDDLGQQGGGVLSIQNRSGEVFDAIVFGEQAPGQWLAGSNFFKRTQDLRGVRESEATTEPVHLMMVYGANGEIACYRNGEPYGTSYKTELQTFAANDAVVLVGLRHGDALGGNRSLRGRVSEIRVYDRALDDVEVAARAREALGRITRSQVLAAMSDGERGAWAKMQRDVKAAELRRSQLLTGISSSRSAEDLAWIDLAHSLFNMKEFIYVR